LLNYVRNIFEGATLSDSDVDIMCRIWGSDSGGHEELWRDLLWYNMCKKGEVIPVLK
jgi:hypothetical protein